MPPPLSTRHVLPEHGLHDVAPGVHQSSQPPDGVVNLRTSWAFTPNAPSVPVYDTTRRHTRRESTSKLVPGRAGSVPFSLPPRHRGGGVCPAYTHTCIEVADALFAVALTRDPAPAPSPAPAAVEAPAAAVGNGKPARCIMTPDATCRVRDVRRCNSSAPTAVAEATANRPQFETEMVPQLLDISDRRWYRHDGTTREIASRTELR